MNDESFLSINKSDLPSQKKKDVPNSIMGPSFSWKD